MKTLTLFLGLLIFSLTCYSQSEEMSLSKYDYLSLTPHTGNVQYTIKLGEFKDIDFDWSFSLDYQSNGFRPMCYSGMVGENWSLNVGGVITREVVGLADDLMIPGSDSQRGLLSVIRESLCENLSKESVYSLNTSDANCQPSGVLQNINTDVQSDIYSFSFNGYHGRFIIDFDGKAHVISGDYVDIDISGMSIQIKNSNSSYYSKYKLFELQPDNSQIKIKTLDGYTYVFGGKKSALGYTTTFHCEKGTFLSAPDIVSWHLTTIISPNERFMSFHYKEDGANDTINRLYHNIVTIEKQNASHISNVYNIKDSLQSNIYPYLINNDYSVIERCAVIDSITTSDRSYKVIFTYQELNNEIYETDYTDPTYEQYKYADIRRAKKNFLRSIKFYSDTLLLTDWDLEYQQLNVSHTTRQYLQKITHFAGLQYHFNYNISDTSRLTNISHVDSLDIGGYRKSNPIFGSLNIIHDPLGNTIALEYARCRYDSIRMYDESANSLTWLERGHQDINMIVIDRITRFDQQGRILSQRRYEYGDFKQHEEIPSIPRVVTNPFLTDSTILSMTGESSGTLSVDFAIKRADGKYHIYPYVALFNSCHAIVTYSKVKEFVENTSTTDTLYRTIFYYDNTPDIGQERVPNDVYFENFLGAYPLLSQANRRANLIRQEEYDTTGKLCRTIHNTYNPLIVDSTDLLDIDLSNARLAQWYCGRYNSMAYKYYKNDPYLMRKRITDYEISGEYYSETGFLLDEKGRTIQQTSVQGNNGRFTNYYYPDNLTIDTTSTDISAQGYLQLIKDNCINTPVETIIGIVKDGMYYITNGEITLYKKYGKYIQNDTIPSIPSIRTYGIDEEMNISPHNFSAPSSSWTLSTNSAIPLSQYQHLSFVDNKVLYDERYEQTQTYTYNLQSRIIEIHPIVGIPIYFEWDEKNMNLLSKRQGDMTTTYSYIPHVGIKSMTDPRGVTTYYSYDRLGNLIEVYQIINGKKVILQAYHYHYSTQETL